MFRPLAALAGSLVVLASIAGCSTGDASPEIELTADTILIDVRTPAEYDAGHLEGATLLDLNGGEFAAALPTLDPNAEYAVYCKSGNRSGQAVALMEEAGFENIIDLGSIGEAEASTQIEVVQ
ncbi:rhodanese-like domain-containing protein [Salinibacterium sp. NG253]|uniref:rhodanese-like domain-containing protein n=1 Tax=Salinibacterium sp. NG253 TaxID=2792039 RepID=UPI0018CDB340|nr:rhodanese-like domain-containing protein [Salinibacterium sp. NG253]MBH0115295.1 rhodanese-like domain-containing protein [Salinibacterium sp. NG253]